MTSTRPICGSERENDPARGANGIVFINLALMIFAGVVCLLWFWYYTEWFAAVVGGLSLGGILAWGGVVFNFLSGDFKNDLREWFEKSFLPRGRTTAILFLVLVVVAFILSGRSGILVDALGDDKYRLVEILDEDGKTKHRSSLSPHSKKQFPVRRGGRYRVRASGLPSVQVDVPGLSKEVVYLPVESYRQPIMLIVPSFELWRATGPNDCTFEITIEGLAVPILLSDYNGESVWVGCDSRVAVPDTLKNLWHLEGVADNLIDIWSHPRSLIQGGLPVTLEDGTRLKLRIFRDQDKEVLGEVTEWVSVRSVDSVWKFPQKLKVFASEKVVDGDLP